ncbi:ATPase AAA [Candidatus Methylomirabilis lanthanidiphila]|uniref:Replication-associated recombination protein A n=1 Tax=Candidatus Methylomirabilis lanthanidiphila TaxID=2211376 RepID=A0A564ZJD3_9BACT|nr:replication-associated recombination protein A [Candidatus Methylomirabilis lanthanidiphila]VUZ85451.1 ATPase AAA [Candidatus Methylomirabilis lanthanidiphila]
MTPDLFDRVDRLSTPPQKVPGPLADRMRPRTLQEFVGQEHLLGEGKLLRRAMEAGELPSLILWGPPGSGKTTLAFLLADWCKATFVPFSAVTSGIKEIKEVIARARQERVYGRRTLLFIDEIHRFNKAQQDAFLPHVEGGTIVLIGATTENPSFEVIAPLLSRAKVVTLHPLAEDALVLILRRALGDQERGLGRLQIEADDDALRFIAGLGAGDARVSLNTLELAAQMVEEQSDGSRRLTVQMAREASGRRTLLYDKTGEEHYNLISALHKSLRGSDPDASLYWLARMLASGEDPLYITRRLIRFASEDVGNAEPQALQVALAAKEAYHFLGSPEGELALAQAVVFLATAPKSNAVYRAFGEAQRDVEEAPLEGVPLHLRNAPTALMKDLEYGAGYQYPHDLPEAFADQDHLPEQLKGRIYYRPTDRGLEAEIGRRLAEWRRRKVGTSPEERR